MGFIRRYGDFPGFFVPDEGEMVLASRSPAGPFRMAYVVRVRRASRQMIRVDFVWAENAEFSPGGVPPVAGGKGHAYVSEEDAVPLIRRIPAGYRPAPPPSPVSAEADGLSSDPGPCPRP